jgi:hypothetical protein
VFSPEFVTSATVSDGTLVLGLRLNWFRPLPLSCVEELTASVDELPLPAGVLVLDGAGYDASALVDHDDVWWGLQSRANLLVPWLARPAPGPVRVTIRTRMPSLLDHTGSPVVVVDTAVVEVAA